MNENKFKHNCLEEKLEVEARTVLGVMAEIINWIIPLDTLISITRLHF